MVSLDDERSSKLSKVLGNKTCEKIINYLAEEKEASEQDIAHALKMPINTVEYNLNSLLNAELIEKSKNFFWSQKGKKIVMYKVSNKSIIISPRSRITNKLKSILPVAIVAGIGAIAIKYFVTPTNYLLRDDSVQMFAEKGVSLASTAQDSVMAPAVNTAIPFSFISYLQSLPDWYWFSLGAVLAVVIMTIVNWSKL